MNELRAVIRELGGERALGRHLSSDRELCEAIREGFRPAVVEELMRTSGLTLNELAREESAFPRGACNVGAAADAYRPTSPIGSIGSLGS